MQLMRGVLGTCCLSSNLYINTVRAAYVYITYSNRYVVPDIVLSDHFHCNH